jgi:hypothetical protein
MIYDQRYIQVKDTKKKKIIPKNPAEREELKLAEQQRKTQVKKNAPKKRAASIKVTEGAYMLKISNKFFSEVILKIIGKEMEEKVRLLSCLPYFCHDPTLGLIPIANIMQKRVFKFGESIIKRGETPTSMFMIAKGMCHLVHIAGANRCLRPDINVRCMKKSLQDFNFAGDKTMKRNEKAVIEKFAKPVFNTNNINVEDVLKNSDGSNGKAKFHEARNRRNF